MGQATKERIIEQAFMLFKEDGYENVSVQRICDACSITKPTFYRYLKSKEDLIACFYEGLTQELASQLMEMMVAENYWEQIWTGFQSILKWSTDFGQDLYSQLFIINLKENRGTFTISEPLKKVMISLLTRAKQNGQIRNTTPPEQLYEAAVYLSFGYGVRWCMEGGNFDLLMELREALANLFDVPEEYRQQR